MQGTTLRLCIELHKPIKHLLRYRGSIDVREESRIQGEGFLPEGFMIYPTISWYRHGRLVLACVWLFRLLTAHSKGDAANYRDRQEVSATVVLPSWWSRPHSLLCHDHRASLSGST